MAYSEKCRQMEELMSGGTKMALAQILGGISVASCSTLVLAPMAINQLRWEIALLGLFLATLLAAAALTLQRR